MKDLCSKILQIISTGTNTQIISTTLQIWLKLTQKILSKNPPQC